MADDMVIKWDEKGYRTTFQSLKGPIGKNLILRCERLAELAKGSAPKHLGRLVASIGTFYYNGANGDLHAHVGANPSGGIEGYAVWIHEGTGVHAYGPSKAPMLVFPNRLTGIGTVRAHRVVHPGNKAYHYITTHTREVF